MYKIQITLFNLRIIGPHLSPVAPPLNDVWLRFTLRKSQGALQPPGWAEGAAAQMERPFMFYKPPCTPL